MKTIETKLFNFAELSEDAKKQVLDSKRKDVDLEFLYSDLQNSLEVIASALNFTITDYQYGPYSQNYNITISGGYESGKRELVKLRQVLREHGYTPPEFPGVCGFTGVCYDDLIVESLWKHLSDDDSWREAFNGLAYDLCKYCEKEIQYLESDECILEYLDQEEEIYTENGEEF